MTSTLEQASAILKAAEEATPGPWVSRKHLLHDHARFGDLYEIHVREAALNEQYKWGAKYPMVFAEDEEFVGDNPIYQVCFNGDAEHDAHFIALARNTAPAIASALLEKHQALEEAEKLIRALIYYGDIRPIDGVVSGAYGSHREVLNDARAFLARQGEAE